MNQIDFTRDHHLKALIFKAQRVENGSLLHDIRALLPASAALLTSLTEIKVKEQKPMSSLIQ